MANKEQKKVQKAPPKSNKQKKEMQKGQCPCHAYSSALDTIDTMRLEGHLKLCYNYDYKLTAM